MVPVLAPLGKYSTFMFHIKATEQLKIFHYDFLKFLFLLKLLIVYVFFAKHFIRDILNFFISFFTTYLCVFIYNIPIKVLEIGDFPSCLGALDDSPCDWALENLP